MSCMAFVLNKNVEEYIDIIFIICYYVITELYKIIFIQKLKADDNVLVLTDVILEQTNRALWEVKNVINCVPDDLWNKEYCDAPMWQHIYHMLHSLDRWFINPNIYSEPDFHTLNLNNLDIKPDIELARNVLNNYYYSIKNKITDYIKTLTDEELLSKPTNCQYDKFTLILAQFRHLHTHMGMIMDFIINDKGLWPTVLGLQRPIPADDNYEKFC